MNIKEIKVVRINLRVLFKKLERRSCFFWEREVVREVGFKGKLEVVLNMLRLDVY